MSNIKPFKSAKMGPTQMGFVSLFTGVAGIFFYQLWILQIIAIMSAIVSKRQEKTNPFVSKWQSQAGLVLGVIYLFEAFALLGYS